MARQIGATSKVGALKTPKDSFFTSSGVTMTIHFKKLISVFFVVLFFIVISSVLVNAGAVLSDLENQLMCKCDDKCGKVLINCTCSTADKNRKKFTKMLESGLTVEQIVQQQVEKYGETVLSAPTKNGFNLTAWVIPFGAIMIGGVGLRKILRGWVGKDINIDRQNTEGDVTSELPAEESGKMSSSKYSRRLKDELDQLET
jgi:cytochrome c-type biogenesis protein CcmH